MARRNRISSISQEDIERSRKPKAKAKTTAKKPIISSIGQDEVGQTPTRASRNARMTQTQPKQAVSASPTAQRGDQSILGVPTRRKTTQERQERTQRQTTQQQTGGPTQRMGDQSILGVPTRRKTQDEQRRMDTQRRTDTDMQRGTTPGRPYTTTDMDDRTEREKQISSIGEVVTPGEPRQPQTYEERVREAAVRDAEREKNLYLQDLGRVQTLQQRKMDDLAQQRQRREEDIDRQLEEARISTDQKIGDVIRQTKQNIAATEKYAALQGFGRSTGYVTGLENIREDSLRTVNRLREAFNNMKFASDKHKARLTKDYNDAVTRATEDLDFQLRDLKENAQINMNALLQDLDLDPDIVGRELEKIDLDIASRYNGIMNQYQQNITNYNNEVYRNIEFLQGEEERLTQQAQAKQDEIMQSISQYGLNMDMSDIVGNLEQGNISEEQARSLTNALINGTIATIDKTSGIPGVGSQFYDQIVQQINEGKTPHQIIGELTQSEEYKAKFPKAEQRKAQYTKIKMPDGSEAIATYSPDGQKRVITDPTQVATRQEKVQQASDLIKNREGFHPKAYRDVKQWSVGYGSGMIDGKPVTKDTVVTREQAEEQLKKDLEKYTTFEGLVTAPLSAKQYAALQSFEYNLGQGIRQKNAMPIIHAVNNGNFSEAGRLMRQYNKAGGKYMQGLQDRRNAEADFIQSGAMPTAPAVGESYLQGIGTGVITSYGGLHDKYTGIDIDGNIGDKIPSIGGEVVEVGNDPDGYGNYVDVKDGNGYIHRYSHLNEISVKVGDFTMTGDKVGTLGNTGYVLDINKKVPTKAQLAAGVGGHLDYTVRRPDGSFMKSDKAKGYIKTAPTITAETMTRGEPGKAPTTVNGKAVSETDRIISEGILAGTNSYKDLTPTDRRAVIPIVNQMIQDQLTDDENRNMILRSVTSTKELSEKATEKFENMESVAFQLDNIEAILANQNTGPILGKIKKMNPYDTDAQVAMAQLAGLTPKVARGLFGEVGVLTDADIQNYQRALPNLDSTEEKNQFVIEFMRDFLSRGYEKSIITQAKAGRNVSRFLSDYDKIQKMGTAESEREALKSQARNLIDRKAGINIGTGKGQIQNSKYLR